MLSSGTSAIPPFSDHDLRRRDRVEKGKRPSTGSGRQAVIAKRLAEVIRRAAVLARLEIGEREVEPHPGQFRIAGQHGAKPRDGGFPVAPLGCDRAVAGNRGRRCSLPPGLTPSSRNSASSRLPFAIAVRAVSIRVSAESSGRRSSWVCACPGKASHRQHRRQQHPGQCIRPEVHGRLRPVCKPPGRSSGTGRRDRNREQRKGARSI